MAEENVLKYVFRGRYETQEISIKKIGKKRRITARFEDCDGCGILVVLKEDKTEVVNGYAKNELKTFIPWHQIVDLNFL